MVTDKQRKLVIALIQLNVWESVPNVFGLIEIRPTYGTNTHELFDRMREKQKVDDLHHAPACPANHYHKMRLVFHRCNCGAEHYARREQ